MAGPRGISMRIGQILPKKRSWDTATFPCQQAMSVCFSVVVESWGMSQNVKPLQLGAFLEKHPFSDPHLRIVPTKVHHQRSIPCTCLETILSGLAISLAKGNSWVDSLRKPKAKGT